MEAGPTLATMPTLGDSLALPTDPLLPIEGGTLLQTHDGLRVVVALDRPTAHERRAIQHGSLRVTSNGDSVCLAFGDDVVTVHLCPAAQTPTSETLDVELYDSVTRTRVLHRTAQLSPNLARALTSPNDA